MGFHHAGVAFAIGLIVFVLDGLLLAKMVRALLGAGERRGRGFMLFLAAIRLFVIAGILYLALVPAGLPAVWLVAGALCGLAVFCIALVVDLRPNFSLFSGGKLR